MHYSIIALMRGSHCPKGAKDEVKPARRAQSRSLEVGARRASRLLVMTYCVSIVLNAFIFCYMRKWFCIFG